MNGGYIVIMEDLQRENRELREEVNRLRKGLEEKESKNKDLQEEVNKQKEEINELKEANQKLRQTIFGLKTSKKRGPPFGHKGTSRKRPDRVDTTIVLELEFKECPYCGGVLKELEDVRVR
ncbi:Chromosome segregation ATPase [Candidatus Methanophagaceae archaeon]|nr:Chromosome segregation ATPase [Methanophagales archaeon]